ncbi:MAG: uroporphyrinogen decarboxylase [Rhodovibrionaceae bacterium]
MEISVPSARPPEPAGRQNALLRALGGEVCIPPPLWLMRQAGRYLPEYRKTRAQAGGFLELCYTPELAVEVTLQPIRRFGFDGAILFSDILVLPDALGQKVWFEAGQGPRLEPLSGPDDLAKLRLEEVVARLAPVYRAIGRLRRELPEETALIGFAGAPWTVASYMIEGGSSKDFATAKTWAYRETESFQALIDLLVEATAQHLIAQIDAGAQAVQIFDSWAGVWPEAELRRWSLVPLTEIVAKVKAVHPHTPVILFPRGAGLLYEAFARESGADALSLDTTVPLDWARQKLQPHVALQGNLDPIALVAGGAVLEQAVAQILESLSGGPFIFNLGHGIVPQTPVEHVTRLVELVRKG